jgi:hypothetical protein
MLRHGDGGGDVGGQTLGGNGRHAGAIRRHGFECRDGNVFDACAGG